jgi:hypothetical protein
VGIENSDGTLGASYYYAPASGGSHVGTAPKVATDILSSAPPSQAVTFSLKLTGPLSQPKLTDVATLTNSTNTETQQAAVSVQLVTSFGNNKEYFPLIGR